MSCDGRRLARFPWLGLVLSARGPDTPSARLVACGLFNHMEREGTGAAVSERTLAIETRLARSTVQLGLRQLGEHGWVLRREKGRGQFGSVIYVHEATIPDSIEIPNGPVVGPISDEPDESENAHGNGPVVGPMEALSNGPMSDGQWTDSRKPMDRLAKINGPTTGPQPLRNLLETGCGFARSGDEPEKRHTHGNGPVVGPITGNSKVAAARPEPRFKKTSPEPRAETSREEKIRRIVAECPDFTDHEIAKVARCDVQEVRQVRAAK
jgi:hypothetical protein